MKNIKQTIEDYFFLADVQINGSRPWDIQVNNPDFYSRVLAGSSLALGESYMDGWWDCKSIDEFIHRILSINLNQIVINKSLIWNSLKARVLNMQSKSRAYIVGQHHYDIGNDLYKEMLGVTMAYSCGYWREAKNLDEAQIAKLDLSCRKLGLKPGMRVLDVGCGWGSFVKYAAEKYGVECVGITVSAEQQKLARENCAGLPVEIRMQDYRGLKEKFDRVISIGMFEHVGYKNYRDYFKIIRGCLKSNGLFLLHTIGGNKSTTSTDPWIDKYIFPNGMLPSAKQIAAAYEKIFVLEDWHSFGPDYDKTLMAWYNNFIASWDKIKNNYDERFFRMWSYYLLACAGGFRVRSNQLWQIVFSEKGVPGGYESVR